MASSPVRNSPIRNSGQISRITMVAAVAAIPIQKVAPALRDRLARSAAPAKLPTLTVLAWAMAMGIMKVTAAIWLAIAAAASAAVPNSPIRKVTAINMPASATMVSPMGTPMRRSRAVTAQSITHSRWKGLLSRKGWIMAI